MIESVFKGAFGIATKILPTVKHLLLELVIVALKIYIAAKPLVAELRKIFGAASGETVSKGLMMLVEWMGYGIIFAVKMVTVMVQIWEAITNVETALLGFVRSAATIATDFIAGLVNGITGGAAQVVGAVKQLGTDAIAGVKNTLGIHSPSRVMLEMGTHTATGFAEGIEAGAPKARGAMTDMAAPPAAMGRAGNGSGSPVALTFNVYGVAGAEDLKAELPGLMAQAFERISLMGGT
jgi:hypothetical protein